MIAGIHARKSTDQAVADDAKSFDDSLERLCEAADDVAFELGGKPHRREAWRC